MKINGSIDFGGVGFLVRARLKGLTEFPANPGEGEFAFVNRRPYVCVNIEGNPAWVPLGSTVDMYRYDEGSPSLEWVIHHNLGSSVVFVQVFGTDGKTVGPDSVDCSVKNTCVVKFLTPQAGTALVMLGDTVGTGNLDYAYENTYPASTVWTVQHNLGYRPAITCIDTNGLVIQPATIDQTSTMQAIITWSAAVSGTVRCV